MNSKVAVILAVVIVLAILVVAILGLQGMRDKAEDQSEVPAPQISSSVSMFVKGVDNIRTCVSYDATNMDRVESDQYYYSEPAQIKVRAYSMYPVLSLDVEFSDDQFASVKNMGGSYTDSSSSFKYDGEVTISLLPGDNITCTITVGTQQPPNHTNRYLGLVADDGISVKLKNQTITGLLSTGSQMLEIISSEPRNISVAIKEQRQMIKVQSSDSPVTRMYVELPATASQTDSTGTIYVAYAENGKTPEYTIYLPECTDPIHPTTYITYLIDDKPVPSGLVTLTDFARLSVKATSNEQMGELGVHLYGTSNAYHAYHGVSGYYVDSYDVDFSDCILNWVEGNYLISVQVSYFDLIKLPEKEGSTFTTVNINSDVLNVTQNGYPNQKLLNGDQVKDATLHITVPDGDNGTLYFTSQWDTKEYSTWLSGVSHSEGYQNIALALPSFIMMTGEDVYGSITLNWTSD